MNKYIIKESIVITALLVSFFGCQSKNMGNAEKKRKTPKVTTIADTAIIMGVIANEPNALLVLNELSTTKIAFIDSTRADENGVFTFKVDAKKSRIGFISINRTNPPGVPIILESNTVTQIKLTNGQDIGLNLSGTKANENMDELYKLYTSHNKVGMDFQNKYSTIKPADFTDSLKKAASKEYETWKKGGETNLVNFINKHPGTPTTYFACTFVLPETPLPVMDAALVKLKASLPTSNMTKELDARLNRVEPLSIGSMAPDIVLKDPSGKIIKLSSLRGKVVLIDFWASWCGPCIREVPNVKKVYSRYKDKNFEVYAVSLDNNKAKWEASISRFGLTWLHVSDLKGWKSAGAQLYQVGSIPATFLIDANGRIIAKNLRGAALEAKLGEIFN